MTLEQFLSHVADPGGINLCYTAPVTADQKPKPHHVEHFTSVAALEERAKVLSAEGRDLYFTPAHFSTRTRNKANAKWARSIWIDIDARDTKGCATVEEAQGVLEDFRVALQLPAPTVVLSGAGIHAYWTAESNMHPAAWNAAAKTLHTMVKAYGGPIASDTARITDMSSMMRLPGFRNHYRGADATVLNLAPALSDAAFASTFAQSRADAYMVYVSGRQQTASTAQTTTLAAPAFNLAAPQQATAPVASLAAPVFSFNDPRPASAPPVAAVVAAPAFSFDASRTQTTPSSQPTRGAPTGMDTFPPVEHTIKPTYAQLLSNCELLSFMAENPNKVSEPEWKYAVNIILHTVEGADAVHEFSAGYTGYDRSETDTKINAAKAFALPVTCTTLVGVSQNACVCDGCPRKNRGVTPLKGATDVKLVQGSANALEQVARTREAHAIAGGKRTRTEGDVVYWDVIPLRPGSNMPDDSIKLTPPPVGYVFGNLTTGLAGVFAVASLSTPLTEDLLWVDRRTETLGGTAQSTGYRVNHIGVDGVHRTIYIKGADLAPREMAVWVTNAGIATEVTEELRKFILLSCDMVRRSKVPPLYIVESYGWYTVGSRRVFVTPTEVITEDGASVTMLLSTGDRHTLQPVKPATGTTADWLTAYRTMFNHDDHHAHFYVLCSLSSALFAALTVDSAANGMIMTLAGQSATGKTWLTKVCQTVWQEIDLVAGNSTMNGLVKEAIVRRHIPLFVDDLVVRTSLDEWNATRDAVLTYTIGREKSRSTNSLKLDQGGRWANIMMCSTNEDLTAILERVDKGGGAGARLVETRLTSEREGCETSGMHAARAMISNNNGVMGVEFIRRVMEYGFENVHSAVSALHTEISRTLEANGMPHSTVQLLRIRVQLLAMCMFTAQLMEDLMPYPISNTLEWVLQSLRNGSFSVGRSMIGETTRRKAMEQMHRVITTNIATSLILVHPHPGGARYALADVPEANRGMFRAEGSSVFLTAAEYAAVENERIRVSRAKSTPVIQAFMWDGTPAGFYVSKEYLNSTYSNGMSYKATCEALGPPSAEHGPTGDHRSARLNVSSLLGGRSAALYARYVFITQYELDTHGDTDD